MEFIIDKNTGALTGYNGTDDVINLTNQPIKILPDNIFEGKHWLREIQLPDTLWTIGEDCFHHCENLTTCEFPSGLLKIKSGAFNNCTSLRNIGTIPGSVEEIGDYAFCCCGDLLSLLCLANIDYFPAYGFSDCKNLSTADISNAIQIGEGAFEGCENLQYISLPNNLERINRKAFYKCKALHSITIPSYTTYIGVGAFKNCSSIKKVNFSEYLTVDEVKIDTEAFAECNTLTHIVLPKNITDIEDYAFADCAKLMIVKFGSDEQMKLLEKADLLFSGCSKLTTFVFPSITFQRDKLMKRWIKVENK